MQRKNKMMSSKKLAVLLAMGCAALVPTKTMAANGNNNGEIIMTNPLNLNYLFEERGPVHRTCADPVIVLYHDKYFLFSSHAAGYSYSDNLRDWTHIFSKMPLVKEWAPAVMVYNDYIYYLAFGDSRLYRTNDPDNDRWELVNENVLPGTGDPDFFVDKDNRVYFLYGCSSGGPMKGFEVDPKQNFKRITDDKDLVPANGKRLGWEVPGDWNELTDKTAWNEGACIIHSGDYYFYTYATPGTEYTTYCTGAYVSKNPLGPYEVMKGNPYAIKPQGFIPGGGHGHSFVDRYGNEWWVASMILGSREHFERRIGIFPAFHNKDYGHVIMDDFDKPFVVPNRKVDFEKESILLDMSILSSGKKMTASSWKGDMTPDKASDDYIRSWWSANSGNSGEWLQMDLGSTMNVQAIQVCFTDEDFNSRRYDNNIPIYKYIVEGSVDGDFWHTIADRSNNEKDQILELLETNDNVRYIRVTNRTNFNPGKFAITELRVFGKADVAKSNAVTNFNAVRGDDSRRIQFRWDPVEGAEGYIIRWGATPERMDHASRVYGTSYDYGFFDTMSDYYVSVQPFNEAGLGEKSRIIKIDRKPSITNYVQGDGEWLKQAYLTVNEGGEFKSGPQSDRDGSWSWTGPNGFTSNDREIHVTGMDASKAGIYTMTFKGNDGTEAVENIMINVHVNNTPEVTPYVNNGSGWNQSATVSVLAGGTVQIGPQVNGGFDGTWRWNGPDGFTSDDREIEISNIKKSQGGIYTLYYIGNDGTRSTTLFAVTVTGEGVDLLPYASDKYGFRNSSEIAVTAGEKFTLSPQLQSMQEGTWSWSGPNGFSSTAQNVTVENASEQNAGFYFASFKDKSGMKSSTSFTVRVISQPLNLTPYVSTDFENWSSVNTLTVEAGENIWVGPQANENPWTNGTWLWTGPNGFTSNDREFSIQNVTAENSGTYSATFTDEYGRREKLDIEITVEVPEPEPEPLPTGIKDINTAKDKAATYNLGGTKVDKATSRGIYIKGGQKVVIGK